ncbi:prolyl oligopeptidase family serine peptidase [Actinotalea sp. M2MS4P-6]|uniref:PHB depolymerase family esterase n=1 Tax=Actinotalea sp. M2MS4P-6 TaxID=2983762 RepID=UPI0021E44775|nr:PHB depolymerase family esterase [Actinotalea sp. M2MS4P-6]MCV2396275.1 prolyl oligopeptidase family serine peptidase [Actinotalea sp. M2MS4P-6]
MKRLRTPVIALVVPVLLALTAGQAQATRPPVTNPSSATFTMNAEVLDGGQQIVSLTIDTKRFGVKRSSVSTDTFSVHATGVNPYTSLDPSTVFGTFDVDREVTGAHVDRAGRIVLDLAYGFGTPGASTFAWANSIGRNIMLDLTYTITQNEPITVRGDRSFTFAALEQGDVVDREVDAFAAGESNGLSYRLYSPRRSSDRPLIVWLHGGGEGGWAEAQDNDLPLIANRGALGFATPEAQRIFRGAYVLAPQATDYWLNDPVMGYSAQLKALIDDVVATHDIDPDRIYVVGASNGGYMAPRLAVDYPDYFAAVVPICPALVFGTTTMISDAELATLSSTPTWIVQAVNDPVLPFAANGQHMADVIDGSILSAYPDVTWDGVTYLGHWSWIYVARNDPVDDAGVHIWQWMAAQSLD